MEICENFQNLLLSTIYWEVKRRFTSNSEKKLFQSLNSSCCNWTFESWKELLLINWNEFIHYNNNVNVDAVEWILRSKVDRSSAVWPDAKLKSGPIFWKKSCPRSNHYKFYYLKVVFSKKAKTSTNFWATFARKIYIQTF